MNLNNFVNEPELQIGKDTIDISKIMMCGICDYPFMEHDPIDCPACEYDKRFGKSGDKIASTDAGGGIKTYKLTMKKGGF